MRMRCGGFLLGVTIKAARMEEFAQRTFFSLFPLSQVYCTLGSHSANQPRDQQTPTLAEKEEAVLVTDQTQFSRCRPMIVPLIVDEYLKPEHIDKLDGILFKASDFFTAQVDHEIGG